MNNYKHQISELIKILSPSYPKLPYHNFDHALDVWSVARFYAIYYELTDEKRFIIESGALIHDVVYKVDQNDNEEKSVSFANLWLPKLGYSQAQVQRTSEIVLATKWPTHPKNLLEEIICDADIDNLGRDDFFEKSCRLLKEWQVPENLSWYNKQLQLLENNQYYTSIARKMRDEAKRENIKKLKEKIQSFHGDLYSGGKKC